MLLQLVLGFFLSSMLLLRKLGSMRRSAVRHTVRSSLTHLGLLWTLKILGKLIRSKFDKDCKNAVQVNEETLLHIIGRNKHTNYGKRYNFSTITSKSQFIANHPLTRYDHYKEYIQPMMEGKPNTMCQGPLKQIGTTSGTSGSIKHIPMVKKQGEIFFRGICLLYDTIARIYPEYFSLQKSMKIMFEPEFKKTACGLLVGPNSSRPGDNPAILNLYSSPREVYFLPKEYAWSAKYLHLLWALYDSELGAMECNFAAALYDVFQVLEDNWRSLVDCIRLGKLPDGFPLPEKEYKILSAMMKPNPARAAVLEKEFSKGFQGIIRRIWPHFIFILTCDTGSSEFYGRKLETYRNSEPPVPLYSPLYGATEGLLGIAIDPSIKAYTFPPNSMFVEFIPINEAESDNPVVLDMKDIEIGGIYELVITTYSGLCRYRFGDVIRIHSFYGQSPVWEFYYRLGQVIDLRGEKTSELALYQALTASLPQWGLTLVDWTTVHFMDLNNPHNFQYHYFIEVKEPNQCLTEKERQILDQELCKANAGYQYHRRLNNLGLVEVHLLEERTFQQLIDMMRTTNNVNQIKLPRLLRVPDYVQFIQKQTKVK